MNGWMRRASRGRSPIHTPIGTQMSEASAISTTTRNSVSMPRSTTWPTSLQPTSAWMKSADLDQRCQRAAAAAPRSTADRASGCCRAPRALRQRHAALDRLARAAEEVERRIGDARQQVEEPRALQHHQEPRRLDLVLADLLEFEALRPSEQRAEQKLIVDQDEHEHGEDRVEHGGEIALVDGERDIGADARQQHVVAGDADRLRGDDEEPAARHRHHHVPDELRQREGHFELPEALPGRQVIHARGLAQIVRHAR